MTSSICTSGYASIATRSVMGRVCRRAAVETMTTFPHFLPRRPTGGGGRDVASGHLEERFLERRVRGDVQKRRGLQPLARREVGVAPLEGEAHASDLAEVGPDRLDGGGRGIDVRMQRL